MTVGSRDIYGRDGVVVHMCRDAHTHTHKYIRICMQQNVYISYLVYSLNDRTNGVHRPACVCSRSLTNCALTLSLSHTHTSILALVLLPYRTYKYIYVYGTYDVTWAVLTMALIYLHTCTLNRARMRVLESGHSISVSPYSE